MPGKQNQKSMPSNTYTNQSYFMKYLSLSFALLCYKLRDEDTSVRLAQQGGMIAFMAVLPNETGEGCDQSLCNRFCTIYLAFLRLSLEQTQRSLLICTSFVAPERGSMPQIWWRFQNCTSRVHLAFSIQVCNRFSCRLVGFCRTTINIQKVHWQQEFQQLMKERHWRKRPTCPLYKLSKMGICAAV